MAIRARVPHTLQMLFDYYYSTIAGLTSPHKQTAAQLYIQLYFANQLISVLHLPL